MTAPQIDGIVFVSSLICIFAFVVIALRVLGVKDVNNIDQAVIDAVEKEKKNDLAKTRVYICGPMTGLPDYNYPAFNECAKQLRELGFIVENPAENPAPPCGSYEGYLRAAIAQLVKCDQVVLLPGWGNSNGARLEVYIALALKIVTTDWHPDLDPDWLDVRKFALSNPLTQRWGDLCSTY
jgi:hypothetical protein